MRTPVVLVTGQGDSDRVAGTLMGAPGTLVVGHEYDGQVVRRWVSMMRDGELSTSDWPLELTNGCVCCTTRNDLLVLLRRLHRRDDVTRIVVLLAPWSEPEPVCVAINEVPVHVGPGYIDGPAGRDVRIDAVVATVDSDDWLHQAVGSEELDDGRTVAQVVVGQAEFADLLVLNQPDSTTLSVLRRLAPLARITVGVDRVEQALAHLDPHARRGRRRAPHDPLLAGQPPLDPAGEVTLMEFTARRPFHPQRLHAAVDMLLDGVVRTRGRAFVANRLDDVMWIESAGGGMLVENAGTWLAAMEPNELARTDPERRALAAMGWDDRFGDRHISMAVLICGAQPDEIDSALRGALLTDHELALPREWSQYPDPFGDWHADPCDELPDIRDELTATQPPPRRGTMKPDPMAVVKINAIEVPPGAGPELEKRFAHRAHAVDNQPGFLGFQLLRPVKGEDRYFVVTQWESEEAFEAWASGPAIAAHAGERANPVSTGASLLEFVVVMDVARADGKK